MVTCPVDLWRAVDIKEFPDGPIVNEKPADRVLWPLFERKLLYVKENGKEVYREPDMVPEGGMVPTGKGTSLYDKDNFFKGSHWRYLRIPAGTQIDPNLKLTGPKYNHRYEANHYQIEAIKRMFVDVFTGALDNLARAAVEKAYADARRTTVRSAK